MKWKVGIITTQKEKETERFLKILGESPNFNPTVLESVAQKSYSLSCASGYHGSVKNYRFNGELLFLAHADSASNNTN